jgi:hypothetical protein
MSWEDDPYNHYAPGDNLSHGELRDRQGPVLDALHQAGLTDKDWRNIMPMESGHVGNFFLHPQTGRWKMEVHHHGDPDQSLVESDLGMTDHLVPHRAMSELRHRDVVGAMGEQMKRAYANGTPHGLPGSHPYPQEVSHVFSHYPEQEPGG